MSTKELPLTASSEKSFGQGVLSPYKRIVVKIGSALLIEKETSSLRRTWFQTFVDDLVTLKKRGHEVIVVSSGAVGLGKATLHLLDRGQIRIEEKRACAAVGQMKLASAYQTALAERNVLMAQILLTLNDTETRQQYLGTRETLSMLLSMGVIPIINENDTVASSDAKYGDNDRLAARVGAMMDADCVVLLSDIDGLYTADPSKDPSATFIPTVETITPEIEAMAGGAVSGVGSGGMATKIMAARIATQAGCDLTISKGAFYHPLMTLDSGGKHTKFKAGLTPYTAKKQWILGTLRPAGAVIVDDGANKALRKGGSLLPAGIVMTEGNFGRGDCIVVKSKDGYEIARGLTGYNADEVRKISGCRSSAIAERLGYTQGEVVIHRDNLALSVDEAV